MYFINLKEGRKYSSLDPSRKTWACCTLDFGLLCPIHEGRSFWFLKTFQLVLPYSVSPRKPIPVRMQATNDPYLFGPNTCLYFLILGDLLELLITPFLVLLFLLSPGILHCPIIPPSLFSPHSWSVSPALSPFLYLQKFEYVKNHSSHFSFIL